MLSKILTIENCAKCRNCCVFHEKSRWETPVVSKNKAELIKEKLHNENCVISYNDSYVLASVKRSVNLNEGQEIYRCAALDENSGCSLSDKEKPFDCSLWPLRVMDKDNKIFVMIAGGCPIVDEEFINKAKKLLSEDLKQTILEEIVKNPDIIKPFDESYISLCDITEEVVKGMLLDKDSDACEDCYLGMYVWHDRYNLKLQKYANGFVFKADKASESLFPMPLNSAVNVISKLLEEEENLKINRVTVSQKQFLENNFPDIFEFKEDTGSFDYLYDIEKLINLSGKKLSKKRNHINAFLAEHDNWHIEEINAENINKCKEFAADWYDRKLISIEEDDSKGLDSLNYEKQALYKVLENYFKLDADGIILKINEKIAALTIGQRISDRTYDVVFEKANDNLRGSYNMINREFARYLHEKYPDLKYINRENDLDLPGLRKAKKSYMPYDMVIKYNAIRK